MGHDFKTIISNFCLSGDFLQAQPYGNGHINDTYVVYLGDRGSEYRIILQRINTSIFADVDGLMSNILGVTSYLGEVIKQRGGDPYRETLTVIKTKDGAPYYRDEKGNCWRAYIFVEGTVTLQIAESREDFYKCGLSFGRFIADLDGYPANTLHETIPSFHNTIKRFEAFEKAIKEDVKGRAASVKEEIDFAISRKEDASLLVNLLDEGKLPLRVTHNDTKINNILIDDKTRDGLCVIDLDTVMPGLSLYDFGDSIRSGASTGAEDETDLSKVSLSLDLFEAFADGFLASAADRLTPLEIELMPHGAKIMTFECGLRFLTDYLSGDTYFKIHREHHNLDRCRTQFKLVKDMEDKSAEMDAVIKKLCLTR